MGAEVFGTRSIGRDAHEAFRIAVEQAAWAHGHEGYTGTIAEKDSFTMITLPEGVNPWEYSEELIEKGDRRIDDKWGPAGCFKGDEILDKDGKGTGTYEFFFFGWASS